MTTSVNNPSISDERQKIFSVFIQPLTSGPNPVLDNSNDQLLINSFNIQEFKNDFNPLINNLKLQKKLHIDDIFRKLAFYPKLSKTLKLLIQYGIDHNIYINNHTPEDRQKMIEFSNWYTNNYFSNNDVGVINIIPDNGNMNIIMLNDLINNGYFNLYNKVVQIENLDVEGNDNLKLFKELSILISKYYFLTEVLLKLLLDTDYNNNQGGNDTILNNFTEYSGEKGFDTPHNYNNNVAAINNCNSNNTPTYSIRSKMKSVIIKQIHNVLKEFNSKLINIRNLTSEYVIDNSVIDEMNNKINKLDSDKKKFIHYGRTLEDKQEYIKKNNSKDKRNLIIILVVAILIVIANLYVYLFTGKNTDVMFQINISIIVVIIITKFYYLLK